MKKGRHLKKSSSAKGMKRALIASGTCALLCGLLLFSSSVAWFTSTKESNVNELYSGNLDIVLSYSKDMSENSWTAVTEETSDIFKVNGEPMLWEPGAVNVVYFKIENKGNLSANYEFAIQIDDEVEGTNLDGEEFELSDYIRCGAVAVTEAYAEGDAGRLAAIAAIEGAVDKGEEVKTLQRLNGGEPLITGELAGIPEKAEDTDDTANTENTANTEAIFALVLYMPESTGDATNYNTPEGEAKRPGVSLKVKLVASQTTGETDSFGKGYDDIKTTVSDLTAAITDATNDDIIRIGGYDMELEAALSVSQNITIIGDGEHAIENYPTNIGAEAVVTFKNVNFDDTTEIEKASSVYGDGFKGTLIFDGCTFGSNNWEAVQITPAGNCTIVFKNCTFNGCANEKRFIHIQPASSNNFELNVTVTNCTFNDCDLVNYDNGENADANDTGTVIDFDYFAVGSTITMGKNTFNLSSNAKEGFTLHPYFCTADGGKVLERETLLGYLTGDVKTYTVTASGLTAEAAAE